MQVTHHILESPFDHSVFSMFFKNEELDSDFMDSKKIKCSFSHFLIGKDLPKFGSGKEFINPFHYDETDLGSGIINR